MENKLDILRHSTAHILAAAILEMFPEAKFGIGPNIDDGFYYDFDLPRTLIPEDLPLLEEKMRAIIKANHSFERSEIDAKKAVNLFKEAGQSYKVELIEDLIAQQNPPQPSLKGGSKNGSPPLGGVRGDLEVSIYKTGGFVDLCRGSHLDSTGEIKADAFKLTKIAGAYWRSDAKNKMLQRIYGTAWESKKDLDAYLKRLEDAESRDHKKLGKELDLFSFHPEAPGSAFWHPKGMAIWNELEKLGKGIRQKYGNLEIQTPILAKSVLWETSGHWEHYKDDMFHFKVNDTTYALKPMDCPFNIKLYQEKPRSYRELPIRYCEIGRVFRNEKSGELNGLLRVQHITQDDAHIFAAEDQIEQEINSLLQMVKEYYEVFKIEPHFFLATRPDDNFMGEIKTWDKAEKNLANALKKENIDYELKEKDGAFYGPKIDIEIKDAIGRRWQLATIQLDFQLPERFDLEYIDQNGKKKQPVMIHAAIFGAFERFIAILTEHYAGAFPVWLAPEQVWILPVGASHKDYASEVTQKLRQQNIRAVAKNESETIGKKIRAGETQKIPYLLVVGDKEITADSVAVRQRGQGDLGTMKIEKFIEKITKEIKEKI